MTEMSYVWADEGTAISCVLLYRLILDQFGRFSNYIENLYAAVLSTRGILYDQKRRRKKRAKAKLDRVSSNLLTKQILSNRQPASACSLLKFHGQE
jgi:hypothetical protein